MMNDKFVDEESPYDLAAVLLERSFRLILLHHPQQHDVSLYVK